MTFDASTYGNFVAESSKAQSRLFRQYDDPSDDFDIIIVGSGIGGGILADDLADRLGGSRRILVLEAGSFLYPTHVYNCCRFPNGDVARHFGCDTFRQDGDAAHYIGEKPQLAFGGRSIFWSGLIPRVQPWELEFFPPGVRDALSGGLLETAAERMNASRSMGKAAAEISGALGASGLGEDFVVRQTPRALHQPYLMPDGTPNQEFFTEPTGVFNTAELLINQLGLSSGRSQNGPGLQILLNRYVEDVQNHGGHFEVLARNTLDGGARAFRAGKVVLAAGSIESPKLLRRSSVYPWLPDSAKALLGRGLTDHPTTKALSAEVTHIGSREITRQEHAKIIFYSKGAQDGASVKYPFNVEMNVNHEYWHLRENDPTSPAVSPDSPTRVDIKFSFGNPLDDANEVRPAPPYGYVPDIVFGDFRNIDRLAQSRFPALAGWTKDPDAICATMNDVAARIFAEFRKHGAAVQPDGSYSWDSSFGYGTVHHAVGTLRMPFKPRHDAPFDYASVVDENLQVAGTPNLFVCDMSVMPISTAANPVRALAALALRLSATLG